MGRTTGRATQVGPVDQAHLRELMQTQAREQNRAERRRYQTPQWLEHSFVLPDEQTPARTAAASHHLPQPRAKAPDPLPMFDRPPTAEVDFAVVVRRADLGRRARIATIVGLVVALLGLVAFELTGSAVPAVCALVCALVTLVAAGVRIALNHAPVPYLPA